MKRRGFLATAAALFLPWTKPAAPSFDFDEPTTQRLITADGITIYDSCSWNRCLTSQEAGDVYNYYLDHGTFDGVEAVVPGITQKFVRDCDWRA